MLKELIEKGRYSFHDGFDNWEDAVKAACAPLEKEKVIEKEYADLIINSIKKHGPYIVIAPKIAIPHAQLFFVLASVDNEVHLKNLTKMVELISDEETVEKLLEAQSVEDLKKLV